MESNMIEDNIDGNFEHEIETKEEKNNAEMLNKKRAKVSSSENEDDYSSKHKAKKRTHNPNRKRALQSLLEFYMSDDNLINDKFLTKFLKSNPGIDINLFLSFNKVKKILCDISDINERRSLIIKSCENSKKIYAKNDRVYRYKKYDPNDVDTFMIEECTLYIENLPKNINHDIMYSLFSDWKVKYISIPRFANKESKGFAFVTLCCKQDLNDAMMKLNNTVPKEIINLKPKELCPLNIITKKEWIQKKEKFKEIKQKIQKLNQKQFEEFNHSDNNNNKEDLYQCSLVRLYNIRTDVNLEDIQIFAKNYIEPLFIDYDKGKKSAILRFQYKNMGDKFVNMLMEGNKKIKSGDVMVEKIEGEEEKKYYDKVKELKEKFQEKKKKRKETVNN